MTNRVTPVEIVPTAPADGVTAPLRLHFQNPQDFPGGGGGGGGADAPVYVIVETSAELINEGEKMAYGLGNYTPGSMITGPDPDNETKVMTIIAVAQSPGGNEMFTQKISSEL